MPKVALPHCSPVPADLASEPWPRAIILVDMNAFFASVEQHDNPEWRGRPVAITNGLQGTCIITCSYEARAFGVKTGMRLKQAREKCPALIQCPTHPERYAEVSTSIMSALHTITPDVEIFSVDEAFLDVTRCQKLHHSAEELARLVKQTVYEASGLLCSVGMSGDKTTAKHAAKQNKPDGLTIVLPSQAKKYLHTVPVTELCGINKGIGGYLAERGVLTCGDMARLPISELGRRFGNIGRRIWKMCQGNDPDKVTTEVKDPKSIGHGKVMPPNTTDIDTLLMYLLHMSEKVAARLRRYHLQANHFYIGAKTADNWLTVKPRLANPTQDERLIYGLCKQFLNEVWSGEGIHQVQITALNPHSTTGQLSLFDNNHNSTTYHKTMDNINQRYGELCLAPARLLNRSSMPNVIAPAWKPFGHRQTIEKTKEDQS
ncbi:MAG: DNA polymerase IV [Gammaproteobacteria bacterium]|nr:DNA polymerase IV [Gammaproteobacteria bacterium]MCW9030602.1 DNA polymerase IV [Gammaproteobacteria bacterium]